MKSRKHFFISGTNTDVGKTVVSRAIIAALAGTGRTIRGVKPVESGAPLVDGIPRPADAGALTAAAGVSLSPDELCAYSFTTPVSPHLAARIENRRIETQPILEFLAKAEDLAETVIAEGAGGLLVPLNDTLLYADLIAQTGYHLVIVAPNVLGTINATLLSIEAARARNIPIAGVILNGTPETEFDNAAAIAQFGGVPVLGCFPTAEVLEDSELARLAEQSIDLGAFA